jgi:hypothetical protein
LSSSTIARHRHRNRRRRRHQPSKTGCWEFRTCTQRQRGGFGQRTPAPRPHGIF